MVWTQFPPDSAYYSDPRWWDAVGQDLITQRRIWGNPSEAGQVDQFRQLLHERPDRALDMMFAAAAKGKPHVVRFLLEQGVKGTAVKEDGDDMSTVPLHAASFQGRFECVKILVEEAKVDVNTIDDMGGTPLMRACWGKRPEVVEYLLKAGADITMRQSSDPMANDETTPNAFEFGAGSPCLECIKLLIGQAEELSLHVPDLVTPLSLSAAAQSDDLDTLVFLLKLGGYLLPKHENSEYDIAPLTEHMKAAIEGAFAQMLQQGSSKNLKQLFAIIDSRSANGEYHWPALKDSTKEAIMEGLVKMSAHDDEEHRDALLSLFAILFSPASRFTEPEVQDKKSLILNDAFYWAAQNNALDTMKLIASLHPTLNVNHLTSALEPIFTTPLWTAAGSGFSPIVSYLFAEHGSQLDTHLASGKFANGPTALFMAVADGQRDTVKLLLELGGGPLESIDAAAKPTGQRDDDNDEDETSVVIVTATRAFRSPVRLVSEAAWVEAHGELSSTDVRGTSRDGDGNEVKYVVLRLTARDAATWWDRLQLRKSDADLLAMETSGRPLRSNPTAPATASSMLSSLAAWLPRWSLWW